jgi:hypothetical protein
VQIPTTEMDQFIVAASVVSVAGSEYRHGVRGEVFLTGGVHTIELRYAQQSSVTQPRTFSNRLLRVRPAA